VFTSLPSHLRTHRLCHAVGDDVGYKLAHFSACVQDFLLPVPYKKFMPIPSAISIPFYIGAPIAIDFCLGGAVLFFWRLIRPETAAKYGIVTGAGLMVGDGIWQLPFGILGIAKVKQV
jgi:uncharacterized oligopeptide transporter (OPT) family protein